MLINFFSDVLKSYQEPVTHSSEIPDCILGDGESMYISLTYDNETKGVRNVLFVHGSSRFKTCICISLVKKYHIRFKVYFSVSLRVTRSIPD